MRWQKSKLTLALAATAALSFGGCDSSTNAPDAPATGDTTQDDAPAGDLGTPADAPASEPPADNSGTITLPGLDTSATDANSDADHPE